MNKVLLAIGNSEYSKIIRNRLSEHDSHFNVSEQEVMHHKYLEEIVELEKPDILIVHDYYLPTDLLSKVERESEWLSYIQKVREEYDDSIRFVFLCEREKGDPFLSHLVSNNVLDIFIGNAIDIAAMIEQLKDKPRFSRVSKYKTSSADPIAKEEKSDTVEKAESEDKPQKGEPPVQEEPVKKEKVKRDKPEKPVKPPREKKVINKTVEKRVVNKQVVKRDFNIQVLNQVEKVVGVPVEKKLILIGSPFSRSGSSFVSHLLAKELANMGVSVSYIESPYAPAYSYDRFIGHINNPDYRSKFYQFTKEIDPKIPSVFDWTVEDINMITKHPVNEPIYSFDEVPFDVFVKILFATQSTVTIVDVGTDWKYEIYRDIFDVATDAYFVVEPDISNIQYLEDPDNQLTAVYREMLKDEKSCIIGNRFDEALLDNKLIQQLYEDKLITVIPEFPSKDVFNSQVEGTFINKKKVYKKMIHKALYPIMMELLPKDFLKKYKKQHKKTKGLFKHKLKVQKGMQEDTK